jgi:integrase
LYQHRLQGKVTFAADDPLWWTLRPPYRQLTYDAARMMFTRAGAALGADYSLHDLRHTAAYRMARDPKMLITDIILSFRVSQGRDLRRPVVDSVADGTLAA